MSHERPALVLACKLGEYDWEVPKDPKERSRQRTELLMAKAAALFGIMCHTPHPSLPELMRALYQLDGAVVHCEMMFTMPCTFVTDAPGRPGRPCHAPCAHPVGTWHGITGRRVRPAHAVAVVCTMDGVHLKESPRQGDMKPSSYVDRATGKTVDLSRWIYYRVQATDEEIYRAYVFCLAMVGSEYRLSEASPSYLVESYPECADSRIYTACMRPGRLEHIRGLTEYAEELVRMERMHTAARAFDTQNPTATVVEQERHMTAVALDELGLILDPTRGTAPGQGATAVMDRVNRLLAFAHTTKKDNLTWSDYMTSTMIGPTPHKFTCVQFVAVTLFFSGIMEKCQIWSANALASAIVSAAHCEDGRISQYPDTKYDEIVSPDSTARQDRAVIRDDPAEVLVESAAAVETGLLAHASRA